MAKDKIEELRIAKRRMEVARLYLQGKSYIEIAERLKLPMHTVAADLRIVRDEWVERALMDFDQKKAEELAKIDRVEERSWEAWDRSCEDAKIMRRRQEFIRERMAGKGKRKGAFKLIPIGKTEDDTTKGQAGDPRFLERIGWCIETRLRVLGMWKGDTINQQVMNLDFSSLLGRTEEPDDAERRIAEVKLLTGITSTPKCLELTEGDSDEKE